jgi:hypothetical protein
MPGHLVTLDVWLDDEISNEESITHEIELRTSDELDTYQNKAGFLVSDISKTSVLQKHVVTLPSHYRKLLTERRSITMYVSVTCKGQDIVVNMIRPRGNIDCLDIDWLTLPELLGTYGEREFEIFRTSLQVTSCKLQTLKN